jgi:hypothetical protein
MEPEKKKGCELNTTSSLSENVPNTTINNTMKKNKSALSEFQTLKRKKPEYKFQQNIDDPDIIEKTPTHP